jgi:hypothetical protein
MKRLDLGHLHPLLEHLKTKMSRPGIKPGLPASQASTLAKSYSNSVCPHVCRYVQYYLLLSKYKMRLIKDAYGGYTVKNTFVPFILCITNILYVLQNKVQYNVSITRGLHPILDY